MVRVQKPKHQKFLLDVATNEVPCFDQRFCGRFTEKELTQHCGILGRTNDGKDRLESGDAIMADKGLDIDDILQNHAIKLNLTSSFLRGKEQLTEVVKTRRIASLHIHVERAIERTKSFRILDHFPVSMCSVASRLVKVCTFLTVLKPPLVPPSKDDTGDNPV